MTRAPDVWNQDCPLKGIISFGACIGACIVLHCFLPCMESKCSPLHYQIDHHVFWPCLTCWQIGQGQDNKIYVQIEYPIKCQHCNDRAQLQFFIHNSKFISIYRCFGDYRTVVIASDFYWPKTMPASFGIAVTTRHQESSLVESFGKYDCRTRSTSTLAISSLILFTPSLKRQPQSLKTSELL